MCQKLMFVEYCFDHYVQFARYVYILSPSLKLGKFLLVFTK